MTLTRRTLLAGTPLLLAGCVTRETGPVADLRPPIDPVSAAMYAALDSEPFPVPAVDLTGIDPRFLRQEVDYATAEPPGTIVVDPGARFAYLVREKGRAIRYGVGVGRRRRSTSAGQPPSRGRPNGRAGHRHPR